MKIQPAHFASLIEDFFFGKPWIMGHSQSLEINHRIHGGLSWPTASRRRCEMDVSKIGAVWNDGHAERNDVVEEVGSCIEKERQSLKKYLAPQRPRRHADESCSITLSAFAEKVGLKHILHGFREAVLVNGCQGSQERRNLPPDHSHDLSFSLEFEQVVTPLRKMRYLGHSITCGLM
jgi:hypothetical protein